MPAELLETPTTTTPAPTTLAAPEIPATETDKPSEGMNEEARGILSNIFQFGDAEAQRMKEDEKAKKKEKPQEPAKKPEAKPAEAVNNEPEAVNNEPEAVNNEPEPVKADHDKSKPKPPPRKAPAIDPVDLARETAKAMGAELGASLLKNQERRDASRTERAETAIVESLTPKQRSKHEVLLEMSKVQPDRYGAAPSEYLTSLKAAESYKLEWQKNNPGKRFDPANEEHDSFFESVEPQYDEDDYADARANIKLRPLEEKLKTTERLAEKVTRIEEAEETRRVEPIAAQHGMSAANETLRKIDPKYVETFKTPESAKANHESDPEVHEIVEEHARRAGELVATGIKILESGGVGINREDPAVKQFFNAKAGLERQIKGMPADAQYDPQGRKFATWDEFVELVKADPNAKERFWYLDQRLIASVIPDVESQEARKKIAALNDGFDKRAAARGYVKTPAVPVATPQNGTPEPPPKPAAKPHDSPSAPAGKVQVSTTAPENGNVLPEWKQTLVARFDGR